MAIYAIADPHLSHAVDKPMDVFGPAWADHARRFFDNWRATVAPGDLVLIPGDLSWGMRLEEAEPDLRDLDALPGVKVAIPGNHDYWWQSLRKLRGLALRSLHFLQNDALLVDRIAPDALRDARPPGLAVCGTRGWLQPGDAGWNDDPEHNARIHARELIRLRLSLQAARKAGGEAVIAMLHYPPLSQTRPESAFASALEEAGFVTDCLYGHLHGAAHRHAFDGVRSGVRYRCVAADYVDFTPVRIY